MTASNASLRQLRAFIEVADRGSFIAASQSLNMSQPALSHCIRQLEGHVGSALFNRSTRHVHLTPLGIGFLPMARDLVNRFDSLMSDVQDAVNHKHGNVTVACLPSVASRLMPRVLVACDRQYPGIHVTIRDANMKGGVQHDPVGRGRFRHRLRDCAGRQPRFCGLCVGTRYMPFCL